VGSQDEETEMYVGIDVAKASLQVCVLSNPVQQQPFSNTKAGWKALDRYLSQWDEVWVVMEATGTYGDGLTHYLFEAHYRVSVINPARIKAYGKSQMTRHKTDAIDAHLIADFCRTQQPMLWQPMSAEAEELRELMRHLDDLKQSRQREKNRLEAKPKSKVVVKQIEQLIGYLDKQIEQATENIRRHIEQHPQLKSQSDLLTSIPGIGFQTSAQILAQLGDLSRFEDVRQVVAMVGLDPTLRQSGSSMNYTVGIARLGHANLRAALYMPAMVAVRCNPLLKVFAQRMVSNGLKPLQVIVAVMRKLLHLAYGVIKNQLPFDPNFGKVKVAFP
jgi:transposase